MLSKIAIGAVQFGLNYGISNRTGQTPPQEVTEILSVARQHHLDTLDTAYAYGNSEQVLGQQNLKGFKIISKFTGKEKRSVSDYFQITLKRLDQKHLYGYLAHSAGTLLAHPQYWRELEQLRASGKVKKIGYSLYSPIELEKLLSAGMQPDLVQVTYNILDRRFEPYFKTLIGMNVEIHTRSTFLQGLFFMDESQLPSFFDPVKPVLSQLSSRFHNTIHRAGYLLQFCLSHPHVSKTVVGVNTASQLRQNIESLEETYPADEPLNGNVIPESILMPSEWPQI